MDVCMICSQSHINITCRYTLSIKTKVPLKHLQKSLKENAHFYANKEMYT